MKGYISLCTAGALLACAVLILTSCSESFVYQTPIKSNSGYGPPAYAPAHGYRRKQQQTAVIVGTGTVVGTSAGKVEVVMVNVTNSNGSISQVSLQKQGVGYVGPKGEFYDHLPTSEELKPIYGF